MKQESDADRPNPVSTAKFELNDDEDYAAFADRCDEEESLARRSARSCAARPRSLSRGAARVRTRCSGSLMILFPNSRGRARVERVPEGIEISTPPALRSHSSGESGDARSKEVFDLHIQEMLERGEASSSVVNTLNAFANQIRSLNGQVSSMRREWHDENQQMKDTVDRLATEIATQADADRMRMIVQRFAGEIIPDSRAIVRYAVDEQSEIVDQIRSPTKSGNLLGRWRVA